MSPNTTTLEFQEASPHAADMMLAWDCGALEDLSSLAKALKGQPSEYGGDLFDQLGDSDEATVEFDPARQRYARIIPG